VSARSILLPHHTEWKIRFSDGAKDLMGRLFDMPPLVRLRRKDIPETHRTAVMVPIV